MSGAKLKRADFSCEIDLVVPFHDLDPVGIVWHGNYAKYFELARCALLERFHYGYNEMRDSGFIWPVIDLQVRYIKPLIFKQAFKVCATLTEWEYRLKIDYLLTDASTGQRVTKGFTVQVAVEASTHEMCLVSPPILLQRLGIAA